MKYALTSKEGKIGSQAGRNKKVGKKMCELQLVFVNQSESKTDKLQNHDFCVPLFAQKALCPILVPTTKRCCYVKTKTKLGRITISHIAK